MHTPFKPLLRSWTSTPLLNIYTEYLNIQHPQPESTEFHLASVSRLPILALVHQDSMIRKTNLFQQPGNVAKWKQWSFGCKQWKVRNIQNTLLWYFVKHQLSHSRFFVPPLHVLICKNTHHIWYIWYQSLGQPTLCRTSMADSIRCPNSFMILRKKHKQITYDSWLMTIHVKTSSNKHFKLTTCMMQISSCFLICKMCSIVSA